MKHSLIPGTSLETRPEVFDEVYLHSCSLFNFTWRTVSAWMKDQIQSSSLIKWHVRVAAREDGLHLNPEGYIITSYVIQSRWFAKMVLEKIPLQILQKKYCKTTTGNEKLKKNIFTRQLSTKESFANFSFGSIQVYLVIVNICHAGTKQISSCFFYVVFNCIQHPNRWWEQWCMI